MIRKTLMKRSLLKGIPLKLVDSCAHDYLIFHGRRRRDFQSLHRNEQVKVLQHRLNKGCCSLQCLHDIPVNEALRIRAHYQSLPNDAIGVPILLRIMTTHSRHKINMSVGSFTSCKATLFAALLFLHVLAPTQRHGMHCSLCHHLHLPHT